MPTVPNDTAIATREIDNGVALRRPFLSVFKIINAVKERGRYVKGKAYADDEGDITRRTMGRPIRTSVVPNWWFIIIGSFVFPAVFVIVVDGRLQPGLGVQLDHVASEFVI